MRLVLRTQVGYKRMMYMCLRAEAIIDLIEKPCREIQFRQVAGDFEMLQGKWLLQDVDPSVRHTLLCVGVGALHVVCPESDKDIVS